MTGPNSNDIDDKIDAHGTSVDTLRRHDLITSSLLWLISLFVFADSFRMTFGVTLPGVETKAWLIAPGLLPLILSTGLLIMFSMVIVISLREGDIKGHFTKHRMIAALAERETVIKVLQMLLLCLFVFGLIGRMPFALAAMIYLIAAMLLAKAAKLYQIIIISAVFSMSLTYVFGTLMKIPLP